MLTYKQYLVFSEFSIESSNVFSFFALHLMDDKADFVCAEDHESHGGDDDDS